MKRPALSVMAGFFMRGRIGGMATTNRNQSLTVIGGVALFLTGLFCAMWLIGAGLESLIVGESIWLGSGALMGLGLSLPFKRPWAGAIAGAVFLGAVQLALMFLFRYGT
jgi:hypothetical protein